jgi:hypothetical protein
MLTSLLNNPHRLPDGKLGPITGLDVAKNYIVHGSFLIDFLATLPAYLEVLLCNVCLDASIGSSVSDICVVPSTLLKDIAVLQAVEGPGPTQIS